MVELQSIFKKAYWYLAAAGLLYVTWVYLMTFSTLQRMFVTPLFRFQDRTDST
jgi:hypothetical protein